MEEIKLLGHFIYFWDILKFFCVAKKKERKKNQMPNEWSDAWDLACIDFVFAKLLKDGFTVKYNHEKKEEG